MPVPESVGEDILVSRTLGGIVGVVRPQKNAGRHGAPTTRLQPLCCRVQCRPQRGERCSRQTSQRFCTHKSHLNGAALRCCSSYQLGRQDGGERALSNAWGAEKDKSVHVGRTSSRPRIGVLLAPRSWLCSRLLRKTAVDVTEPNRKQNGTSSGRGSISDGICVM